MVRPIIRDTFLLSQKSADATPADLDAVRDLYDTLDAHREDCAGMAGNMIGVLRRIVAVRDGEKILVFLNPEILKGEGPYRAEEGCLSLGGTRETLRYRRIKLRWQDEAFRVRIRVFEGFTAQAIQHEIDHCNGILI